MAFSPKKVLIIGGTSGLGEGYARLFHALPSKPHIIITGRREASLDQIAKSLHNDRISTIPWDITDLPTLESTCSQILATHPDIDTIFLNAGIQKSFTFTDPISISEGDVLAEITTNVTAPVMLVRCLLPHLIAMARKGHYANLLMTSSSLGYVPVGLYPVYPPCKAFVHALAVCVRQQIQLMQGPGESVEKFLSVCEIVPPYVDTGLDAEHRESVNEMFGEGAFKPMPLRGVFAGEYGEVEEWNRWAGREAGEIDEGSWSWDVADGN